MVAPHWDLRRCTGRGDCAGRGLRLAPSGEGRIRVQDQDDRPIGRADGDDLETRRDHPPRLLPISDAAAAYRLVYGRVDALIRDRAGVAELTVPACPSWTIRQTVAHLAGVAQDIVSLNLDTRPVGADDRASGSYARSGPPRICMPTSSSTLSPMSTTFAAH